MWQVPCASTGMGIHTYLEFSRWHQMTEWWHWMLLILICCAIVGYVSWLYRRDCVELRTGVAASMLLLRGLAFAGVLVTFLGLEQHGERQLTRDSRVILLFDTSLSMGIHDASQPDTLSRNRLQQVVDGLMQSDLIQDLRRLHHVIAYRFDQTPTPVELASLPKLAKQNDTSLDTVSAADQLAAVLPQIRAWFVASLVLFASGLCLSLVYALSRSPAASAAWWLFAGVCLLMGSLIAGATVHLQQPGVLLGHLIGRDVPLEVNVPTNYSSDGDEARRPEPVTGVDWIAELKPLGSETRLGEALRYLVDKERGGAVAGLIVFTDGNSNAGLKPETAANLAKSISIPLFAVGLGSEKRPVNVRISDLQVPPRVFPGDAFTVSGFLQSSGLAGRMIAVQLLAAADGLGDDLANAEVIDERRVRLKDDELVPVKFEVTPSSPGRYVYQMKLAAAPEDQNSQDDRKQSIVRVVERNNRVLLIAGGPTREYRFVRNMLFRDRHTSTHVWLQTGLPGISQEADDVLPEFPDLPDDLFAYDTILAFDIDWTRLNQHQVELLERWVGEKAGGLVLVAGVVHTPYWTSLTNDDARWSTIRALHPVVFYGESSAAFHLSQAGSEHAWPLDFTRDGQSAEFLWLDETAKSSELAWRAFEGVYGFFATKQAKPGAQVYARFSDPSVGSTGELPVYFAGHFYGAGRVFYMASGEMWRLRAVDEKYFEQFYTKLIRYVSQGRLLRDSSRGLLMVGKERCLLGDAIVVRAVLSDSQHRPLSDKTVPARVRSPDGRRQELSLQAAPLEMSQAGTFSGQFTTAMEGDYRIELPVPNTQDNELLVREVRVRLPDLEVGRPQRNDSTLKQLTQTTGGTYYVGMDTVTPPHSKSPLVGAILPQDQVTLIPGAADKRFDQVLMTWLLTLICFALCLEWLLRRLHRLA